jgi:hypothetical protein
LDSVPFTGVAYLFDEDTGMLLTEQDFDPAGGASREWYPSGVLLSETHRTRPDGYRESVCYDGDERITAVGMLLVFHCT